MLLAERGHDVHRFEEDNRRATAMNHIKLGVATVWNFDAARRLESFVKQTKPDVVHFHNTFPLISPAAYRAVRQSGAAVVQTLHNFRLACTNGLLFRDGRPCEQCLTAWFPWPGIYHRCYRDSVLASAAVTSMLAFHRVLGTWQKHVDAYVIPGEFARGKLVEGGVPSRKTYINSNFLEIDPGIGAGSGGYALFAGRLSDEKGLRTLIAAWKRLPLPLPLRVLGDGPLAEWLKDESLTAPHIQWLGLLPRSEVLLQMKDASMLVFPSECYETCPLTILEAFGTGLAVVAGAHGAAASLVQDGRTGLLFEAGNAESLAKNVIRLLQNPELRRDIGKNARREFERLYTREGHYERLLGIYQAATQERSRP